MRIAIIDADLIERSKHRFPNLASMKISAYHKSIGDEVELITDYNDLYYTNDSWTNYQVAAQKYAKKQSEKNKAILNDCAALCFEESNIKFNKVYISKVFTDTPMDENLLKLSIVEYGGTGFFYDKAPKLPYEIEHIKPDYDLYSKWVMQKIAEGGKRNDFTYYLDYSIGFLTRGCFRQCQFCVNKNYKKCETHSSVFEFIDDQRPKLCFLDDNFFACPQWKDIISQVKLTGKRFQFKQGLDERLITDEKIHELMSWKYDGDYIFAFDNIEDRELIESKLKRIHELYPSTKKHFKFYVLCGYDRNGKWDDGFWEKDITDTFERIKILSEYSALPYIMRYEKCYTSEFAGVYSTLAGWCNQPSIFKKFSYRDYCRCKGMGDKNYAKYHRDYDKYINEVGAKGAAWKYMEQLEDKFPNIAKQYFDFTPSKIAKYGCDIND